MEKRTAKKSGGATFIARLKKTWPLYVLLIPSLVYILLFAYGPMYGAQIAFKDYKIAKGIIGSPWVGFKWFIKFFNYYEFWALIRNTLRISIYNIFASTAVAIILSLSLNCVRSQPLKKAVTTITYMPHFVSVVVLIGMVIRFLNPNTGVISKLIQSFGGTNRDLMGVASAVPHIYVWSGIWQNAGWSTILYLASLTGVDPQLHEAAVVDGASRFKRILHIDIPSIIPVIVISLIMSMGSILSVGTDKMLLMQNSLNRSTTDVISTYVYDKGIAASSPQYSYATAIGLMNSVLSFIMVVTVNGICRKLNDTSLF